MAVFGSLLPFTSDSRPGGGIDSRRRSGLLKLRPCPSSQPSAVAPSSILLQTTTVTAIMSSQIGTGKAWTALKLFFMLYFIPLNFLKFYILNIIAFSSSSMFQSLLFVSFTLTPSVPIVQKLEACFVTLATRFLRCSTTRQSASGSDRCLTLLAKTLHSMDGSAYNS